MNQELVTLGAEWTDIPEEATHFVAGTWSRTDKFLRYIASAPHIVTRDWIDACVEKKDKRVDATRYFLKDTRKEKELKESLADVLARAKAGKVFQDRRFFITKNARTDRVSLEQLKLYVELSGGSVSNASLDEDPNGILEDDNCVIISHKDDRRTCYTLAKGGKQIYSITAVLDAIMVQRFDRGFVAKNFVK
ncbi:hypothetical protein JCM11491_000378 [Sporobolomyces phaffii]